MKTYICRLTANGGFFVADKNMTPPAGTGKTNPKQTTGAKTAGTKAPVSSQTAGKSAPASTRGATPVNRSSVPSAKSATPVRNTTSAVGNTAQKKADTSPARKTTTPTKPATSVSQAAKSASTKPAATVSPRRVTSNSATTSTASRSSVSDSARGSATVSGARSSVAAAGKSNVAADTRTSAEVKKSAEKKSTVKAETPRRVVSDRKKETKTAKGGESGGIAAVWRNPKARIAIIGTGVLLLAVMILGIVLGAVSCGKKNGSLYVNPYKTRTMVGYSAEYLGEVKRTIPKQVQDEGLPTGYPQYGKGQNLTTEEKTAMINEASYLCARPTWNAVGTYDKMDALGYLYMADGTPVLDKNATHRRLYKHTAAVGLYRGNVADNEPAIIKRVTMRPRRYGYSVTGVYAPAGEVLKIEISEKDMEAVGGGITIHIGQALYNGKANNIWTARGINRMPVILNTMNVDKTTATLENGVYTAYVGSYLGGPVYIRNKSASFSVTISGGVRYSHFILGYTTPEEFAENAKSSAPYFDLEVWENGVLHSGPAVHAAKLSYDDLYDAAVLWDKIALVSTKVRSQGIVFLYDPFVAAGAAVAFPGQYSVNCPDGWMIGSLNYKSFVLGGAWGNMHEYNHNFQGWGLPGGGEVTNNAINLVEYSLFTKISSARKMGNYGAEGLGGWNRYTSASWAARQTNGGRENDLSIYATLLHAFGQDNFMKAVAAGGIDNYFTKWSDLTHNDMTYYSQTLGKQMSDTASAAMREKNYPMFVPIASVYQTGRSYTYDEEKRYTQTMQPYVIPYGKDFIVDLGAYTVNAGGQYESGSVVLPNGFTYTIKNVTQPQNGKIAKTDKENVYTFTPDKNMHSGKIYVTVEITPPASAGYTVADVDLVLEFEQSHEFDKNILERSTYYYAEGSGYETATAAYESNFAGYAERKDTDNINAAQNSNTDVWYTTTEPAVEGSVVEVRGKMYVNEAGKYRIALRGRGNVALYVSTDANNYEYVGSVADAKAGSGTSFMSGGKYNEKCPYKDFEELPAESWVHFKIVMVCSVNKGNNISSYLGLGWGKWIPEQGTIKVDENGNTVMKPDGSGPEIENYAPASVSVGYATAYRESYEFAEEFTSDYFYSREWNYNYDDTVLYDEKKHSCVSVNFDPWDANLTVEKLFDGNARTSFHTIKNNFISEQNPFELTVDCGETVTANHVTFYGYHAAADKNIGTNLGMPVTFTLYGSTNGADFFEIASYENMEYNTRNVTLDFDKDYTFRYYRLFVTKTDNSAYFAMNKIVFFHRAVQLFGNGKNFFAPDNAMFSYTGNWTTTSANSSFGHVLVGKKKSKVSFTFEGNRFAVLSSKALGANFEVQIDGKKVSSFAIKKTDNFYGISYLSPELSQGKHSVVIECKGSANIDSFATWQASADE